jgi:6,7-dimethyl-8-ribityllumazine synthase
MTEYEGYVCAPGDVGKIAIVVSRFNKTITDKLLAGALSKLREHMVSEDQITVVYVPGAFEIPTLAQRFASDEEYAAVICLGCVIKGETSHNEYINRAVSSELARIGSEYCLPVIFGIITCDTVDQALARCCDVEVGKDKTLGEQPGNKGSEAAEAALEMIDLLAKLPELYDPESDEEEFSSLRQNSERYVRGDFEPVEVDPDSLEEIDDDDVPNWFIRGGSAGSKGADQRNDRGDKRSGKRSDDRSGSKNPSSGKSKPHKTGGFDKKSKKDGDKKKRK